MVLSIRWNSTLMTQCICLDISLWYLYTFISHKLYFKLWTHNIKKITFIFLKQIFQSKIHSEWLFPYILCPITNYMRFFTVSNLQNRSITFMKEDANNSMDINKVKYIPGTFSLVLFFIPVPAWLHMVACWYIEGILRPTFEDRRIYSWGR